MPSWIERTHQHACMYPQGDRRAGTAGPSLSEFNFESQWGQKALKHMYRAICEVSLNSLQSPPWQDPLALD